MVPPYDEGVTTLSCARSVAVRTPASADAFSTARGAARHRRDGRAVATDASAEARSSQHPMGASSVASARSGFTGASADARSLPRNTVSATLDPDARESRSRVRGLASFGRPREGAATRVGARP